MKIIVPKPPKNTSSPSKARTDQEYVDELVDEILWLAYQEQPFTTDDLYKAVGYHQSQRELLGHLMAWAKRHKIVKVIGMRPSTRPESKGRKIREFLGTIKLTVPKAKKPAERPVKAAAEKSVKAAPAKKVAKPSTKLQQLTRLKPST